MFDTTVFFRQKTALSIRQNARRAEVHSTSIREKLSSVQLFYSTFPGPAKQCRLPRQESRNSRKASCKGSLKQMDSYTSFCRPFSIITTSSAIRTVDRRCETSAIVFPLASSFSERRITASFRLSKLLVGSSNSKNGAL